MKKRAGKNQIIITALALMVAVAGYISYTGGQLGVKSGTEETAADAAGDAEDTDDIGLAAESGAEDADQTADLAYDISEEDIFTDTEDASLETDADVAEDIQVEEGTQTADSGEAGSGETDSEEAKSEEANGGEADNGGDTIVGEAVLTGTQADVVDYAAEIKLEREQVRAKNKETLLELINNTNLSEEQKQQAVDTMVSMTSIAERESATESLLQAKGFENVVVSITDDSCDVVVELAGVSDAQRAQIEDIVKRKTGVSAENIVITPYE